MSRSYSYKYKQAKVKSKSSSPGSSSYSKKLIIELHPILRDKLENFPKTTKKSTQSTPIKQAFSTVLPKTKITKQIEDRAVEFETAIKKHLGDDFLSYTKSSGFNVLTKVKGYNQRSLNDDKLIRWEKSLAALDEEEKKIKGSLSMLETEKGRKRNQKRRYERSEEKELKKVEISLKEIDLLLKKIRLQKTKG